MVSSTLLWQVKPICEEDNQPLLLTVMLVFPCSTGKWNTKCHRACPSGAPSHFAAVGEHTGQHEVYPHNAIWCEQQDTNWEPEYRSKHGGAGLAQPVLHAGHSAHVSCKGQYRLIVSLKPQTILDYTDFEQGSCFVIFPAMVRAGKAGQVRYYWAGLWYYLVKLF